MSQPSKLRICALILGCIGVGLFCSPFYASVFPPTLNYFLLGSRVIPLLGGYFIATRLNRFGVGWALVSLFLPFMLLLLGILGRGDGEWQSEWEGVLEGVKEQFGWLKDLSQVWKDRKFRRLVSALYRNPKVERNLKAIETVGLLGDSRGFDLLSSLKDHPSAEVRKAAFKATLKLFQSTPEKDHHRAFSFLEHEIQVGHFDNRTEMVADLELVALPELFKYLGRELPKTESLFVDVVSRNAKLLSDQELESLSRLEFKDLVVESQQVPYTGSDSDIGYYRTVEKSRYYVTKPCDPVQELAKAEIERRRNR